MSLHVSLPSDMRQYDGLEFLIHALCLLCSFALLRVYMLHELIGFQLANLDPQVYVRLPKGKALETQLYLRI